MYIVNKMVLKRENEKSLAKYREYQRNYQRNYGKAHYKPDNKKKYYLYKKYAEIFRNILLND